MTINYKCFRCGEGFEELLDEDRDCPSCLEHHTLFSFTEMGDILNNIYLEGIDLDIFGSDDEAS